MNQTLTFTEKEAINGLLLLRATTRYYLDIFPVIKEELELVFTPTPVYIHIFTIKNYDNPSENDYILPVVCLKDLPVFDFTFTEKYDSFYVDKHVVLTSSGLQKSRLKQSLGHLILTMRSCNDNLSFIKKYVFTS